MGAWVPGVEPQCTASKPWCCYLLPSSSLPGWPNWDYSNIAWATETLLKLWGFKNGCHAMRQSRAFASCKIRIITVFKNQFWHRIPFCFISVSEWTVDDSNLTFPKCLHNIQTLFFSLKEQFYYWENHKWMDIKHFSLVNSESSIVHSDTDKNMIEFGIESDYECNEIFSK